jgi:hypothetical protein
VLLLLLLLCSWLVIDPSTGGSHVTWLGVISRPSSFLSHWQHRRVQSHTHTQIGSWAKKEEEKKKTTFDSFSFFFLSLVVVVKFVSSREREAGVKWTAAAAIGSFWHAQTLNVRGFYSFPMVIGMMLLRGISNATRRRRRRSRS